MSNINLIPSYLAKNIKALRQLKSFSQQQLAELADIPRTTITNLETGSSNPSLNNLIKLSSALGVGLEELISKPRASVSLIPKESVVTLSKNNGRIEVSKLLPDKLKGVEIDKFQFEPQSVLPGHPHLQGTKEYLSVLTGEVNVYIEGDVYTVKKGDVLAFDGNQAHSYRNATDKKASAISVVIPTAGNYI